MNLYLDAGNTRIKWQLRDGTGVLAQGAGLMESPELFSGVTPTQWRATVRVAVSTVRSERAREQLQELLAQYTGAPVEFFWTESHFGSVQCAYRTPESMGADRWHALIGAWSEIRGRCVVVDAGSAITADWLEEDGRHLGGYILPGKRMMLESLQRNTARVLFNADNSLTDVMPGRSTDECVFHGVNWLMGAIGSELARIGPMPLLLTGGDAVHIREALLRAGCPGESVRVRPDLVIEGLAIVDAAR
ncbi:pantothenate kinase [Marinobacter daqiaonensis]|uniref:Type III pantothenate kinase n=1 Tax=Marinobacter daqiaonensis TaxID=650891 RepID=A0A1I6K8L7_9GAMM|nr:type III pantothenate kinase [Marinobacter daqiaonensis]SFR87562.1 pantothenate kinase [Marinobacter daqiaonensis]